MVVKGTHQDGWASARESYTSNNNEPLGESVDYYYYNDNVDDDCYYYDDEFEESF